MVKRRSGPTDSQTWRSFLKNQAKALWSCDFFVQHTVAFQILYVFVVMELASRKVVHLHVTDHPTLEWTKQQIRNVCFEEQPKFLIHDNDGKFGQFGHPLPVENAGKRVSCRSAFDAWLFQEMGIRGISTPYRAPNAAAHIERLIGTLRRECLDRLLIYNERHLKVRTHGIHPLVQPRFILPHLAMCLKKLIFFAESLVMRVSHVGDGRVQQA